jgi:hypothetical protein
MTLYLMHTTARTSTTATTTTQMVPQLVDPSDDRITASTTTAAGDGTELLPDAMVNIESSTVVELR